MTFALTSWNGQTSDLFTNSVEPTGIEPVSELIYIQPSTSLSFVLS